MKIHSHTISIGNNRKLPRLLFVTCSTKLQQNVGLDVCNAVLKAIREKPYFLLEDLNCKMDLDSAITQVSSILENDRFDGVVLLGGLDVIPSLKADVVDVELERDININQDPDKFIVWTDDPWGCLSEDLVPIVPVTRVPDAKDPGLFTSALQSTPSISSSSFGLRNLNRPFAEMFASVLPTPFSFRVSFPTTPSEIPRDAAMGAVYLMLHGTPGRPEYYGELSDGSPILAMAADNVPSNCFGSIVFSGCCWGALTVDISNSTKEIVRLLTSQESISLAYLRSGASAYIGCTGAHYSPSQPPYDYYGGPMHDYFWSALAHGASPAKALRDAKQKYALSIPHRHTDSLSKAIERKILREFVCLGLAW